MIKHLPRKRFGQHFLNDDNVIERIIKALRPLPKDNIVEIGPGQGALTFPLLAAHPTLMAIEIDRDLTQFLSSSSPHLTLYNADVLSFDFSLLPEPLRIIGNLPYNISTPLLFYLLKFKPRIQEMIFMLQKEVVLRLCAKQNTKEYGRLSVMLQSEFEIYHLFDVPRTCFSPPPKVESAIVQLIPKHAIQESPEFQKAFEVMVRECFSHRRKTLKKILSMLKLTGIGDKNLLQTIDLTSRPENLSEGDFKCLAGYMLSGKFQGDR